MSPVYPASQSHIGIPDSTVQVPCLPHGLGSHKSITIGVCIGYNSSCIDSSVFVIIIDIIVIYKILTIFQLYSLHILYLYIFSDYLFTQMRMKIYFKAYIIFCS